MQVGLSLTFRPTGVSRTRALPESRALASPEPPATGVVKTSIGNVRVPIDPSTGRVKRPEPASQLLMTPAPDPASVQKQTFHGVEILILDSGRVGSRFISSGKDVILSPGPPLGFRRAWPPAGTIT
jgi:hypothetical protein